MNSVGKGTCTILVFVSNGNTQKGTVMVNKRNAQIVLYVGAKKLVKRKEFEQFLAGRMEI